MTREQPTDHAAIVGDVVFGNPDSPVAVCVLATRSLLAALAGREEIAIAGRCHTENIGVERMIQSLVADPSLRFLLVCGQETTHAVGQTIVSLHANGLDATGRVIGSVAPEPLLPNLTPDQLRAFRTRVALVDAIGERDPYAILARAGALWRSDPSIESDHASNGPTQRDEPRVGRDDTPVGQDDPRVGRDDARVEDGDDPHVEDGDGPRAEHGDARQHESPASGRGFHGEVAAVEHVIAEADAVGAWEYDPLGYFLIQVDRAGRRILVEHHDRAHRLLRIVEGVTSQVIGQTLARRALASHPAHLVYLGRELMKAELALRHDLHYEQDVPLDPRRPGGTRVANPGDLRPPR